MAELTPLSAQERAVVTDMVRRHNGKLAVRPHEEALLIGRDDFWAFMAEWTSLVVRACREVVDRERHQP